MISRTDLSPGMPVASSDGERVGEIAECGSETFRIEKGTFFRKDYFASYEAVADTSNGLVTLTLSRDQLARSPEEVPQAASKRADEPGSEEARLTVAEEKLRADKTKHHAGDVKVRKEVHTEEEQITVPVQREEVVIERTAAPAGSSSMDADFEQREVRIPVSEEHAQVSKEVVAKEEVSIRKQVKEEEETKRAPVRRESVHVERNRGTERLHAKGR